MIKNFVVKVKQIQHQDKGLRNFLNYLEDEKRHNGGIIKYKRFNKENFFKQTILNITEYNLKKSSGRKSTNYADSFIFTIPPIYEEKGKEKLNEIVKQLVIDIYNQFKSQIDEDKDMGIDNFLNQIFLNIHTDKKHIHINVVFPRVLKNGNEFIANRITNRKRFLHNTKKHWTHNLTKNLNVKMEDYKPTTRFKKGYKNQYLKDLINENNEVIEKIEEKEEEIKKLDELLEMKRAEIKEHLTRITNENERKEKIVNTLGLMMRYYKSLITVQKDEDMKKVMAEYKKLERKINEFEEFNIKNKHLNNIKNTIEKQSKRIYKNYMKM